MTPLPSRRADLGLAIGTGTDVAIEASDHTLVSGDLRAAVDAIRLTRQTVHTIRTNLFWGSSLFAVGDSVFSYRCAGWVRHVARSLSWAFAYTVGAILLAVAGLLHPMVAAAAIAFSSIFVASNSSRPRYFESQRARTS